MWIRIPGDVNKDSGDVDNDSGDVNKPGPRYVREPGSILAFRDRAF